MSRVILSAWIVLCVGVALVSCASPAPKGTKSGSTGGNTASGGAMASGGTASGGAGGSGGSAGNGGGGAVIARDDAPDDQASSPVTYAIQIEPLLRARCTACHSGADPAQAIVLDNYDDAKANAGVANRVIQGESMPPDAPLSAADKQFFQSWVDQGAPQN